MRARKQKVHVFISNPIFFMLKLRDEKPKQPDMNYFIQIILTRINDCYLSLSGMTNFCI